MNRITQEVALPCALEHQTYTKQNTASIGQSSATLTQAFLLFLSSRYRGRKKKTQTGGWDRGGLSSGWVGVAGGEQSGPPRVREKLSASVELLAVAAVEVRLELLHRLNVHLPHELLEVVLAE